LTFSGPIDNLRAQQARLADEKSRLERKIEQIEDEDDLDAADLADLDEKKANLATIDLQFIVANLQVKWYAEAISPDTNQALFCEGDKLQISTQVSWASTDLHRSTLTETNDVAPVWQALSSYPNMSPYWKRVHPLGHSP